MSTDFSSLPEGLVAPDDDGAADHLVGSAVPAFRLLSTEGTLVSLATLKRRTVVYIYPRTGVPGVEAPKNWDAIPGARGCTPQSCSFRDHFRDLMEAGVEALFGLSTQDPAYQKEAAARLRLPFSLLSDETRVFGSALRLPTFEVEGQILYKRVTLVIDDGQISHVFYPVFPPDESAAVTLDWLRRNASSRPSLS